MTENDFFCFAYGAADCPPGLDGVTCPPVAEDGEVQGAPGPETPRRTKILATKVVAEEMPSTDAACVTAVEEIDDDATVSDGCKARGRRP